MKRKQMLCWMTLSGVLASCWLTGCVSVKAPEEIRVGDYYDSRDHRDRPDTPEDPRVDKEEAYAIALAEADVSRRGYDIHDKEIEDVYWVLFEMKRPRPDLGWRNHFAVRVAPDGSAQSYTRSKIVHKSIGRKIEKEDAYEIARQTAHDFGANLAEYDIHDKEINGVYWVLFEHEHPGSDRHWEDRFTIRVAHDGFAEIYTGD